MFAISHKIKRGFAAVTVPMRRDDGAIMMEALIIMPLLAGFYCATLVWFDAFRQKTLIMKASYAVSDVLSRQEQVDEPFLDNMRDTMDYMVPSQARPRMRISLIEYNVNDPADNKYRLRWSYGPHGMTDLTQADLDGDTSWIPVMADDEAVVVTETAVSYQPIFRVGIPDQIYRNTIVTRPRFASTLFKSDEPAYSSNADDADNDGDGDLVGGESDADGGGDPNQGEGHNGNP